MQNGVANTPSADISYQNCMPGYKARRMKSDPPVQREKLPSSSRKAPLVLLRFALATVTNRNALHKKLMSGTAIKPESIMEAPPASSPPHGSAENQQHPACAD